MNELDEFYPYMEMSYVSQSPSKFEGSFKGPWTEASLQRRKSYVETQLELFESPVTQTRRAAQGRILYLLQGCFAETTSPEEQLHWIMENAKVIRAVNGIATLVYSLRDAAKRYDAAEMTEEKEPNSQGHERSNSTNFALVDPYDAHSGELMDVLAMLYFVVEVSRTDETFGDELMAIDPPLPILLINLVAGLKDRMVPKGYPVKKVLLLLWKTLLACLGGMREAAKTKALSRELAGLGPEKKDFTRATPMDIATWRRDTSTKYPTFAPPPAAAEDVHVQTEALAEGVKPLPARTNYHPTEIPESSAPFVPIGNPDLPQPGTPAPTPPQTPQTRPKKLQFQTDPSRPFVFPYSQPTEGLPGSLVPYAIDEADRLYREHLFVSLGLYQLWEAREDYFREERGLGKTGLIGFSSLRLDDDEDDTAAEESMRREWRYDEEEAEAREQGDTEGVKLAEAKRAASRRLYRVEVIYRSMLPVMHNTVIVLLKLLLATVTGTNQPPPHLNQPGPPLGSPTDLPPVQDAPPPTQEEVDVARHREVTSKAVSAIIILLLKWFKASHILKFHQLTQLLLDSNCLVLVLKIFGLIQDTSDMVQTKNEMEGCSFFQFCYLNCSKHAPLQPDEHAGPSGATAEPKIIQDELGEEIELVTDYSWRNMFATINLVKILQKITKHRVHRVLLMCGYKSVGLLKRVLKVNQPMLQLQLLKLIKSQMPYFGRKWRSTNMKVITSIYLNCRSELRDEWLVGVEADLEAEDTLVGKPQELALRALVAFYNKHNYAAYSSPAMLTDGHRRHDSTSGSVFDEHGSFHPSVRRRSRLDSVSSEMGSFPPRTSLSDAATAPYNPDSMIEFWMREYEDALTEVFGEGTTRPEEDDWEDEDGMIPVGAPGPAESREDAAWIRLGELMRSRGAPDDDVISDSESVVTVGELGDDARLEGEEEGREIFNAIMDRYERRQKGDENTWEHMSPTTLKLLPKSPKDRRRSSSGGSPLRPVMGLGPLEDLGDVFEDDVELPGPMPINPETRDELERDFGAVDEVEYSWQI